MSITGSDCGGASGRHMGVVHAPQAMAITMAVWLCAAPVSAQMQENVPLPPVRPPELGRAPGPAAPTAGSPAQNPAQNPVQEQLTSATACLARLAANGAKAEPAAAPPTPLADCETEIPVRLSSIDTADGAVLDLPDRPILNCEFAVIFADYAGKVVAPLGVALLGSHVAALHTGPGYECRGRNRAAGAKTSAHGKGIAIDLAEITLADHRRIAVAHEADAREALFLRTMRRAACGWFTTVLGPGTDAAHAEHLHFDILRHGASDSYRICE